VLLTFLNLHQGCSWKRERLLRPPCALHRDDREEAQAQALSTDRCGDLTRQYSTSKHLYMYCQAACVSVCASAEDQRASNNRLLGRVSGYMQSYYLRIDMYKIIAVQHLKNNVIFSSRNAIRVKCMSVIPNSDLPLSSKKKKKN